MSGMTRTITVVYDGEVFRPEEPVDLEPHVRYEIAVVQTPAEDVRDRPLLKYADLAQPLDLPPDFAKNLHHYLHGQPKEADE